MRDEEVRLIEERFGADPCKWPLPLHAALTGSKRVARVERAKRRSQTDPEAESRRSWKTRMASYPSSYFKFTPNIMPPVEAIIGEVTND
jgi:hypothetical protein